MNCLEHITFFPAYESTVKNLQGMIQLMFIYVPAKMLTS